ncbi:MAG: N-acetyltransferase family protein [Balneolaceae bacterium]|nr:N-acetyltransferase family protein [Balneolaceae bacterium]
MIQRAGPQHLGEITRIYNQAVEAGLRTAHLEARSREQQEAWLRRHLDDPYPVFVDEREDELVGWFSVSPYRPGRGALDGVAEISYYVDFRHHKEGIATGLMEHALAYCREQGLRILVALLIEGNTGSVHLLKKFDFKLWGVIPQAVEYQHEYYDHIYMGRDITDS